MIKAKAGGIMLGGLAGYLIISKALGSIERCVKQICVAREWKHYYKYGKDGDMVPPGYYKHKVTDNTGNTYEYGSEKAIKNDEKDGNKASAAGAGSVLGEAIGKAIVDIFKDDKEENEASDGQKKAFKEHDTDDSECPDRGDVMDNELKDPLYVNDYVDGVKLVDEDEEKTPEEYAEMDRNVDAEEDI